jgi:hypothetical protein
MGSRTALRWAWCACVALWPGASWVRAAIEWEGTTRTAVLQPGQTELRVEFGFVNRGSPVRIRNVSTSCGCTEATVSDRDLGVGERGRVEAAFRVESRRGRQRKTIRVETDDPKRPVYELVLDVEVPQVVWLAPRMVWWSGDEAGARSVEVRAMTAVAIRGVGARAAKPDWRVTVVPLVEGRRYAVNVEPPAGGKPGSTVVAVTVEMVDDSVMAHPVYARVFERGGDVAGAR